MKQMIQACSWRGQWVRSLSFGLFWGHKHHRCMYRVCVYVYIYICIHTHTAIYNNDNNNNICIYTNIDRSNQSCHFYHVIVKVVVPWRIHQRLSFWAALPLDVHGLPSGKHTKSYGKSPCLMVKSTR